MDQSKQTQSEYYSSMRRKILVSMIFVPVIPFVLMVIGGSYFFVTSLQANTIARMTRVVEDHRQLIELFLEERRSDLQFIADTYTVDQIIQPAVLREVFTTLQKASNAFVDLGVFNEDGLHIAYQGPYNLAGKNYRDAGWFKEVMQKGWYVSDVFLGYRNVPHFIIAIARQDSGNTWVIRATIDTLLFSNLVEEVRIGQTGEAYILNGKGVFQTKRRSGGDLLEADPLFSHYQISPSGSNTFLVKDHRGTTYLYATALLNDNNRILVVRQEQRDAFQDLYPVLYLIITTAVLGGLLMVPLAFLMSSRIIRRLEQVDQEKQQLNRQLIMAGRLAEIGEMSAGFAHEINNPLQIIRIEQTLIETILADLQTRGDLKPTGDVADIEDSLRQITTQVERCAKITQAILKFARQKEAAAKQVDLRSAIPEIIDMVAHKASVNGIVITHNIVGLVPRPAFDASELQQVIINLLNNAIDAVIARHSSQGGKIAVIAAGSNDEVTIAVADNGCGISPEHMNKVFTPFFTTKPVGKGTGLGLSVCFGIVDRAGGYIDIKSEKDQGTTVTVHLPAAARVGATPDPSLPRTTSNAAHA